jgi:phage FluMu protein Com
MTTILRCNSCGKLVRLSNRQGISTISCPQCRHEIDLDRDAEPASSTVQRHCISVVAGPVGVGRRVVLPTKGRLAIGSDRAAWLHLEAVQIDPVHCQLERDSSGWQVINRSDRSGTWVNGQAIDHSQLHPGDSIKLGPFELRIEDDQPASPPPALPVPAARREQPTELKLPNLMASRLTLSCLALVLAGLLDGAYHVLLLFQQGQWQPVFCVIVGAVPALAMLQFALFVASPYRWRRKVAVGGLILLVVADLVLLVYGGLILRAMLAGGTSLMTEERRSPLAVASGAVITWTAVGCYLIGLVLLICTAM